MLSAAVRLTRRDEFATAVRRGRRAAHGSVVVHLARTGTVGTGTVGTGTADEPPREGSSMSPLEAIGPKVGFVVGRTVGGAVIRHRVQRRLRHLMRARFAALPSGALVVVRALPAAASASSAVLGADLDSALGRLIGPQARPPPAKANSGGRR